MTPIHSTVLFGQYLVHTWINVYYNIQPKIWQRGGGSGQTRSICSNTHCLYLPWSKQPLLLNMGSTSVQETQDSLMQSSNRVNIPATFININRILIKPMFKHVNIIHTGFW